MKALRERDIIDMWKQMGFRNANALVRRLFPDARVEHITPIEILKSNIFSMEKVLIILHPWVLPRDTVKRFLEIIIELSIKQFRANSIDDKFNVWADKWLSGEDRSEKSACLTSYSVISEELCLISHSAAWCASLSVRSPHILCAYESAREVSRFIGFAQQVEYLISLIQQ